MDNVRAIKLVALKDVMCEPSTDAQWYKLIRWYSKTFATPLHEVDDLPRLDILRAYFSEHYENMDEGELHQELQDLLKPEDKLQNSLNKAKDESDVDDLVKAAEAENKALKAKRSSQVKAAPPKENMTKGMLEAIEGLGAAITNIKKTVPEDGFSLDFSDDSP